MVDSAALKQMTHVEWMLCLLADRFIVSTQELYAATIAAGRNKGTSKTYINSYYGYVPGNEFNRAHFFEKKRRGVYGLTSHGWIKAIRLMHGRKKWNTTT